ncbi:hypothetical protein SBRY_20074 [Actinacidiphila bryophytorum]|uniref:Uncharacterized protein n=1 Tax=Actinacidiphila bryophytorum TaxID=1436133 RepID=A0A9W4E395_9ACTN|nr:hypothetical protein SBRY_20074 [Actinacidiphila bryophytorum]
MDRGRGLEPRPRRRGLLPAHRPGRLPRRPARRPRRVGLLRRGLLTRLRIPRLLPRPPRLPRHRPGPCHLEGRAAPRGRARHRARRGARATRPLHTVRLHPGLRQRPLHRHPADAPGGGRRRHRRLRDALPPRRDQRVRQRVLPRRTARVPEPVAHRGPAHRAGPARRQRARHRLRGRQARAPRGAHRAALRRHRRGCRCALRRARRRLAGGRPALPRRPLPQRRGHVPGGRRRPHRVLPLHPHVLGPAAGDAFPGGLRHHNPGTGLTPALRPEPVRLPPGRRTQGDCHLLWRCCLSHSSGWARSSPRP